MTRRLANALDMPEPGMTRLEEMAKAAWERSCEFGWQAAPEATRAQWVSDMRAAVERLIEIDGGGRIAAIAYLRGILAESE